LGISVRESASVEVMMRFLSGTMLGKKLGLDPVAIITFLVLISFVPSADEILIVDAFTKDPTP